MRHLDLFSGIGGFALAARWVGWETVAFCEIEPYCRQVLRKHWPDVPIHEDIRELDGERYRGTIDVITGGFPCQDISSARGKGAKGIHGEKSGLWVEIARLAGEIRPRYIVLENSPELINRGLGVVLGDLASLGFDAIWHCIPASAVGAPHQRDRFWLVAHSIGQGGVSEQWAHTTSEKMAEALTDPYSYGCQAENVLLRWGAITRGRYWRETEQPSPFVDDGFPPDVVGWAKGASGTGNAIVPQIAEVIFRAIDKTR